MFAVLGVVLIATTAAAIIADRLIRAGRVQPAAE
jgi:hypothetical protein